MKRKTVYFLRIRPDDQSEWSEPTAYGTKRTRDIDERHNRILGGFRTHSYEEKLPAKGSMANQYAEEGFRHEGEPA
jgi:hypothetical protein